VNTEVQALKGTFRKTHEDQSGVEGEPATSSTVQPVYGEEPVIKKDVSELTGLYSSGGDPYRFRFGGWNIGGFKMPSYSYSFSSHRRYRSGYQPRSKTSYYSPTVRDIGKGSSKSSAYKPRGDAPQTYEEVRDSCLEQGVLWEDPDFPAEDASLYFRNPPSVWPDIQWMRPTEMCDDAELFVEGASRLDVNQGILGDCWLLAAVSCLATNERLLKRIIPDDQSFSDNYAGVFRFHFWQYGRWVEVLIDDRLPTHNGKLIYMHSDNRNEFWSAMIEKAYAKLNGSYEALSGGLTSEALTDFTGGVVERFEMRDKAPDDLFERMLKARKRFSLMGCSIDASPDTMEAALDNGLIIGHAYSVTEVKVIEYDGGTVQLVRARNPWGDSHEWKGAWSDDSDEWNNIPEDEKEAMGLSFDHDGEFWMCFEDFMTEFQRLEIVYLGPDTLLEEDEGDVAASCARWEGQLMDGEWKPRVNAGGCRNYNTFWINPQFKIHIEEPDEDDEDGLGSIIVGLMQKDRRKLKSQGKDNHTIGYAIYQLDDPDCGTLDDRFFRTHQQAARSPNYINMREVADHHKLPPGDYMVVPTTFEPNQEGEFILRVYSEKPDEVKELDDATGITDPATDELPEDDDEDTEKHDAARDAFVNLAGADGEIDAYELKDILNELFMSVFEFDGFSSDMTRSMVAMFDADLSGKLGFEDFKRLWAELSLCKKAFKTLDSDGNGYFNSYEFKKVLNALGLRVSNSTFNAIVMRYSDKEGHVRFDDFVACVIKLRQMFDTYKDNDDGEGKAGFELDEFIQMTMYS
jgi:calpain